jgi:peptidoglycan/LPS O-acetylase OafA/YrhL
MYALNIGPVYYSTFTNGGAILAGCAAALAGRMLPRIAGLLGIALIIIGAFGWSQSLAVTGAVLVVLAPVDALLPIAALGRRAYSLYLWSWPFVLLVGGPVALPLTLIAAELSYRLVERRVLSRFHDRLAARSPGSASLPSALVGSAPG